MGGGTSRFAQSFTAGITGGITSAQVDVTKQGTAGDYRLDINEVGAAGVPMNTILASATIPDARFRQATRSSRDRSTTPPR